MSAFKHYVDHGWALVAIKPGQKGPRTRGWNRKENALTTAEQVEDLRSAGLAHAYSGTCAIDVDDMEPAVEWLAERGVDLIELFNAPDAVQITSGRAGHGKLIYALPEPLCSKKVMAGKKNIIDFRCATAAGLTAQDVLPPSIHPDTGQPYKWVCDEMFGGWRELPTIPDALHQIWLNELEAEVSDSGGEKQHASIEELRALLAYQDPDVGRDEWIRAGMAIHNATDGDLAGLDLWDEWSRKGEKYSGRADLEAPWRSFHDAPNAVTVGSLRQSAVATPDEFPDIDPDAIDEDDPWAQATAKRKARFRLTQVSEIAKRPPPEWLVDELLPESEIAMMVGPPRVGKSFAGLDLAFSVSSGLTWFNRKTKAGPVVWLAAEAAGAMRNRARAYAQAHGVQLETCDLQVIEQSLSLLSDEDSEDLADAMSGLKPKLIVVDTLAAASAGANENSGEDMSKVLGNCRKLHLATGALVLLIHHTGKDASRGARGWSGLFAAVRTEFTVANAEGSPIRTIKVTKQSDGVEGLQLAFRLQTVPLDFDEAEVTSCVVEPVDETTLDPSTAQNIGEVQKLVIACIHELSGDPGSVNGAVFIQDVYDNVLIQMPPPADGKRDSRAKRIERSLAKLHERGLITVSGDMVTLGSSYDGEPLNSTD